MTRYVRLRELLLGIEGLALLRHLYDGTDAEADCRVAEVREILADSAFSAGEMMSEADPRAGYGAWSGTYDEPGNPIIRIEEPVVWALLDPVPPGLALDAACGTGRHALHLAELGHEVTGCDYTPEMLHRARGAVPSAELLEADLRALPLPTATFDLVVCGLALAHVAELDQAVIELGRVLKPGGRLVLSVLHPFQAYLGWHAPFEDAQGERGFVREHPHTHADYLRALIAAGLRITECVESPLSEDEVRSKRRAFRYIPEATMAAYAGLPAVLVWAADKAAA
jgi:ubiquinone/menaquinone biosynthesis C-methylase UbiE